MLLGYCGERGARVDEGSREVPNFEQHWPFMERTLASAQVRSASCRFTRICTKGSAYRVQTRRLQPFHRDDGTNKKKCYIFCISGLLSRGDWLESNLFVAFSVPNNICILCISEICTWYLFFVLFFCQFKPVMVKDQEQQRDEKPGKLVTNGRGSRNNGSNPVSSAGTSSAVSPSASAWDLHFEKSSVNFQKRQLQYKDVSASLDHDMLGFICRKSVILLPCFRPYKLCKRWIQEPRDWTVYYARDTLVILVYFFGHINLDLLKQKSTFSCLMH